MAQLKTKQISDFVSAVEGKINGMVGTSVSDAISTAVSGASSTLSNAIVTVAGDLSSYEVSNDAALAAEISRAEGVEAGLSAEIVTVAGDLASYETSNDAALANEISRAEGVEANLSAEIVTVAGDLASYEAANDTALSAEIVRATGVEAGLRTDVDAVTANVDAILAASTADKDSFAEIVELINSVDVTNDDALAAAVLTINDRISDESTARENADTLLGQRIDNLNTDLASDISDAVLVEKNRALGAEGLLSDAISDEESARITADGNLSTAISNLDTNLSSDISAAIVTAADYTNDREAAITLAYKSYADQAEADAYAASVQYTDGLSTDVATVTNALDGRIDTLEAGANDYIAYADQAEADANIYTDGEISTLSTGVATVTNALDGRLGTAESDITALDGRIDALEGQNIVQQVGIYEDATTFRVDAPFVTGDLGLKVFINGLQIHAEASGDGYTTDGSRFTLVNLGYDIDATDHIIVLGVLA